MAAQIDNASRNASLVKLPSTLLNAIRMNARTLPIFAAVFFMVATVCLGGTPVSFNLESNGVSFRIKSPNADENNTVTITSACLAAANKPVTRKIEGMVGDAELADLDGDGTKELLIYVFLPGTGQYGDVVAYSTNGNKSLSEILVLSPGEKALAGYGGHDEWKPGKRGLVRRFPIYREGDAGAAPTGGRCAIIYELRQGEAVWQLVPVKVSRPGRR